MSRQSSRARGTSVDDSRPASANYHANALARGLALLEMLADRDDALTLNDFSEATALPKSTLVRLLAVLAELGYVVRVDERPAYRLGHKVQRLASSYMSSVDLSLVANPYLAPLAESTGQTANLGVLDAGPDGAQVLHVCVAEPDRPLRFTTATGARDHVHCTGLGKLLLSELVPAELPARLPAEPYARFTDSTLTTFDVLTKDLRRTRRRGFAFDDNERSIGLRCVAVPVRVDDTCLAAVSVSGPAGEFTPAAQQRFVAELRKAAAELCDDAEVLTALRMTHRATRTPGRPS